MAIPEISPEAIQTLRASVNEYSQLFSEYGQTYAQVMTVAAAMCQTGPITPEGDEAYKQRNDAFEDFLTAQLEINERTARVAESMLNFARDPPQLRTAAPEIVLPRIHTVRQAIEALKSAADTTTNPASKSASAGSSQSFPELDVEAQMRHLDRLEARMEQVQRTMNRQVIAIGEQFDVRSRDVARVEDIAALPRVNVDATMLGSDGRECAICKTDLSLGDEVLQIPCRHLFHTLCLAPWISGMSDTCPYCRQPVTSNRQ